MKLQTTFMLLLVMALLFTAIGYIISDFQINYPETGDNVTSASNQSMLASKLNEYTFITNNSFLDISNDLKRMSSESAGWTRILSGLIVFAKAIITAILAVVATPGYIISIIALVAADLTIPTPIIMIIGMMVTGAVIFMLVKFLHRSPI